MCKIHVKFKYFVPAKLYLHCYFDLEGFFWFGQLKTSNPYESFDVIVCHQKMIKQQRNIKNLSEKRINVVIILMESYVTTGITALVNTIQEINYVQH